MTRFTFLIVFLITLQVSAQSNLSSTQWQQDLKYLQDKVYNEYSNLFYKITEEKFDEEIDRFYNDIPTLKDHEIKVRFAEIVALFGYGHTALWLTAWRYNPTINFHQLPLNFYWFNDGLYIQGVHKDYKRALGSRIVKIGDTPIEKVLDLIKPVVSSENDQFFKAHGINYLGVPEVLQAKGIIENISTVPITLEENGKQFNINVKPIVSTNFPGRYGLIQSKGDWLDVRAQGTTPLWLKKIDRSYFFEYLVDSKSVYVRQSSVINEEERIDDFYSRVFEFIENNDVDRLIIDLRLNAGGDNSNNKSVILGLIKSEKINQKGKLFVVLGRRTFSAAQNLVNEIENYTEAIFVGEPTAENVNFYGDQRLETLPNSKLQIGLSWAWWQDMDPRDTRQWTAPQYAVDLGFQNYVTNQDPILDAILQGSEIELQFARLFEEGNAEELVKWITKYSKDPTYGFYSFESKINAFGYVQISKNNISEAIVLFELNTELYPDSPNTWDSLAEGYWRTGNISKAKEFYNKVIQMDPEGRTAENSRNMLSRIQEQNQ